MIVAAIYGTSLLLRLEAIQERAARNITRALQELSDLPISIGSVQVQHLNKVVIKSATVADEEGDTALYIPKITAHLSPLYMLKGDIRINTLIIGQPTVTLRRKSIDSPLNIQFLLDRLAGDSTASKKPMPNIRINQIQLYEGTLTYDIEQEERKDSIFDPSHIKIEELTCNLSLKKLTSDTLSLYIRSISGKESKGLTLDRLSARVDATPQGANIEKLLIELPESRLKAKQIAISAEGASLNGKIDCERLTPTDFASFLPILNTAGLPSIKFNATIGSNNKSTRGTVTLSTSDNSLALQINTKTKKPFNLQEGTLSINNITLTPAAITHLQAVLDDQSGTLDILKQLGQITLTGTATAGDNREISGNFTLHSEGGSIDGYVKTDRNQMYAATLRGQNINLNRILQDDNLGSCNINADIQGYAQAENPDITFSSVISSLKYKDYTYTPIEIEGSYNTKDFTARIFCNDPNATGHLLCTSAQKEHKEIKITASIDSIKPHNLNISSDDNGKISAEIDGTYNIYKEGKSLFDLQIYNITQETPTKKNNIRRLHIVDNNLLDNRSLLINSDFLDAKIAGDFDYASLAGTFENITKTHLPAILDPRNITRTDNSYVFNFNIKNTTIISNLLQLPIAIRDHSTITGLCDDNRKLFHAKIDLSNATINKQRFKSINAELIANEKTASIKSTLKAPQGKKSTKELILNQRTTMCNNTISTTLDWANDTTPANNGAINIDITLARTDNKVQADAVISPSRIVYNGTPWEISRCNIKGNADEITIDNLHLANERKTLYAKGKLGKSPNDILNIELKDIKLESILDLVNFRSVEFGGNATGDIILGSAFTSPQFSSTLKVDSFLFEKGYMGDLDFNAEWNETDKSIVMRGDIRTPDKAHTVVKGFVSPANDTISLRIDADRTRLTFLNSMLSGILSDVGATATGQAYLTGPLGHLNLVGKVVTNGPLRVTSTNVIYMLINDTVTLTHNKMSFDRGLISDSYQNIGYVSGSINHNCLGNFTCDIDIKAEGLLAYHCEDFGPNPFHGRAFATGNANITANDKGLFIHADVRSERNSYFVYDAGTMGTSATSNFIKFTDRNKKHTPKLQQNEDEEETHNAHKSLLSRLNLEFMIDVTPDIQLKVLTNRKTGDYIDLYGNGPITAIYDEKEGFSMKGRLDLERGTYKFTMQDIFPKEFDITDGSSLEFNGDPFLADLNLKTKYLVPSASLSDLDPTGRRHKNVKVHCLMDITGKLEAPQLNFDIELPDANEEERELLASMVNTPEQKNMQFIYLMGIGKFYTYDYNRSDGNAESSTAMESLISNTISGQLNNMLSRIIDNRNWNISGNFSSSERGWNSMEVEGILEGRLLDNRLLINGNFGYRENPLANSNFVGDFEIQWLLNKSGNVSLKAYNKTNDRYFSDATLTTQGAGIILRHNFDEWRWWLRNKNKKEKEKTNK